MPKNEDGEFELVLGNRQLLSMFFVVVVLLGVFFVMGYIVGRNSAPLTAEPSTARKTDGKPLVVESPAPKPASAPESGTSPSPEASKPAESAAQRPVETKPELPKTESPKPEAVKSEPIKPSTSRSEPAVPKREAAKALRPVTPANPAPSAQPVAGQTYLQLLATTKHDADATVEVLRKNGFPALDAEVPEKLGTFRVLVGPLAPGEVNKIKADLQDKGFPGNAAIRRTF